VEPDTLTVRPSTFRVLVFTKRQGYSHRSIPAAVGAVHTLGARHGFTVLATDDPSLFEKDVLPAFAAVIFLNTSGNILSEEQKAAFERYVHAGGGVVGIHSALDTEHRWTWYHRLLGADFAGHPPVQRARLIVSSASNGISPSLSQPWERADEWYNYRAVPEGVKVLLSVDEWSYRGGKMGRSHPVTWYHDFDGGRAWYTAMGHTTCSFSEPPFLDHILGGILYAARAR
jgi:type 1 glutamine amidotransferase